MDRIRRKILKAGAAATVMARGAARACAGQRPQVLRKGAVRIHYQETGSGFPLMLIAGGLNSTIAGLTNPFNPPRGLS